MSEIRSDQETKTDINTLPDEGNIPEKKILTPAFLLLGLILILYLLTSFFDAPYLWGINQLSFIDPETRFGLLAAALLVALPALSKKYPGWMEVIAGKIVPSKRWLMVISLLAGFIGTFLFYRWKISPDIYGDARGLVSWLTSQEHSFRDLFDIKNFEPLSQLIHQSLARFLQADQRVVIQAVSVICGGVFVTSTLLFVGYQDAPPAWKMLAVVSLFTAGANQLFFGHVEDYTPAYLFVCLFLIAGWLFFDGRKSLGLMFILLVAGSRFHAEVILLTPAFLYALLCRVKNKFPILQSLLKPGRIVLFTGLTVVVATFAYFFYFQAYHLQSTDPADLRTEAKRKIFLQIINSLPPPHHYTLLSLNHISDVVQEFALTVSPSCIIILALCLLFYRRIRWDEPRVIFFGIGLFYFLLFNFTINPMLSMPWDWDLLALAAAPATFFGLAVSLQFYKTLSRPSLQRIILGVAIAPAIMSCTIFYINANSGNLLRRLESIGEWAYRSYYSETNYIINISQNMIRDPEEQLTRREAMIRRLLPDKSSPDTQIGNLCFRAGEACFRNGDMNMAVRWLTESSEIDWTNAAPYKTLALAELLRGNIDEAEAAISFYNANANTPEIRDFGGLVVAHYTDYVRLLVYDRADSTVIRGELQRIFLQSR